MMNFKLSEISAGVSFMLGALALGAEYRVDNTYATTGVFKQVGDAVRGVVVQPNGNIYLGTSMTPTGSSFSSFALLRQTSNGALDTTFDVDGILHTDFAANTQAYARDMVVSPVDGRIFMVGYKAGFVYVNSSPVYQSDFAVACFSSTGGLDTGFNTTGKQTVSFNPITNPSSSFPYASASAECVAVQSDGKVVVGGWAEVGTSNTRFAMTRFLTTGAIDSTFGTGGYVVTDPGSYCSISAIAISPVDDKIIAVGRYQESGSPYGYKNMVVRYDKDGVPDTSFDTDGIVLTGGGGVNNDPKAVAVLADDSIIVGGSTYVKNPFAQPEDFALFRYTSTGALDTGFGTGGMVVVDVDGGYDSISAIKMQSGGKILAVGTAGGDPNDPAAVSSLALLMFNSNGTLDTSFDTDGMIASTGPTGREGYRLAQQSNGKIIAAGQFMGASPNPAETAAIRYEVVPPVIVTTRKPDLLVGLSSSVTLGSNIYNTTGAGQTQAFGLGNKTTKSSYIGIQNDGSSADSFKLKATPGNSAFGVKYFKGGKNITAAIVAGTYSTATLAPRATEIIKVTVTTAGAQKAKKRTLTITGSSVAKATETDTVLLKLTSKAKPQN